MNRREFLLMCAAGAASPLLGCGNPAPDRRKPRNLILIVSDTLRADHLGCYGSPLDMTPRLDDLARMGTVFTNFMSCSPFTADSHASMMTGSYQTRHTVVNNGGAIPIDLVTLAHVCQREGYETAAFVSNPVLRPAHLVGIDRGFGVYDDALPTMEFNRDLAYRTAPDTIAAATTWLQRQEGRPFFLWVHLQEPHGPYLVPDPSLLQAIEEMPAIEGEAERLPVLEGRSQQRNGIPVYQVLGTERRPVRYRAHYAARTAWVDRIIGQFIADVRRLGLDRETALAFTSDHGELLGEDHYYFTHGITVLPAVLHVPFILAGPGVEAGRKVGSLAGSTDIMPTLLDMLGLGSQSLLAKLQGRSLAPSLSGEHQEEGEPRYAVSARGREWSVMLGQHRYTAFDELAESAGTLARLAPGPEGMRDISAEEPATAARLRAMLQAFIGTAPDLLRHLGQRSPRMSAADRRRLEALGYVN
jgi:arylsulfatase A-like enzyme